MNKHEEVSSHQRAAGPDMFGKSDNDLVWGAVRNAGRYLLEAPRWVRVRDAVGVGSTLAKNLCDRLRP